MAELTTLHPSSTLAAALVGAVERAEHWETDDGRSAILCHFADRSVVILPDPDGAKLNFAVINKLLEVL